MRCRTVLTRIDALRTGELHPAQRGAVRKHLRTCASCDESVADLAQLARAVKSLAAVPSGALREALEPAGSYARLSTSFGPLWVAFSRRGLRMIHLGGGEEAFLSRLAARYARRPRRADLPAPLRRRILATLEGKASGRVPIDLGGASPLETQVLEAMARIPRGEVRSYSWLAACVGRPRAVRAVARVVAGNRIPFVLPCHRVVPAGGGTGEYAFGSEKKRRLLRREGVDVDQLDDLARRGVRLIGSRTTGIACVPTCRDARRIRADNQVPLRGPADAHQEGFRPCRHCRPFAA
ncbi:MAG TPA: methylated-DNA--[protein]-cysteine S-methyltransferase [Candidatus Polarisedimenticolia bacterium]|nr:methylated-DNA--[protein]-cysteine S-methyltransferase [Candidatus Polarisedimenticolia bacterium]